ncbi:unnamed protein product [Lathyrus sativus]|nr:unnamed protein product [Lathyrus sativus]
MTEQTSTAAFEVGTKTNDMMDDENALLQQALAMSMDDPAVSHDVKDADMSEAATDDPELARAFQLSVSEPPNDTVGRLLADQSFVSSILASLPGVDPNDPSVKDLLASMQNQSESQKKNDEERPNEEEKK